MTEPTKAWADMTAEEREALNAPPARGWLVRHAQRRLGGSGQHSRQFARMAFLPAKVRRYFDGNIAKRNRLDRAMAEARLGDANDPRAARFQGPAKHDALDAAVRKAARRG